MSNAILRTLFNKSAGKTWPILARTFPLPVSKTFLLLNIMLCTIQLIETKMTPCAIHVFLETGLFPLCKYTFTWFCLLLKSGP